MRECAPLSSVPTAGREAAPRDNAEVDGFVAGTEGDGALQFKDSAVGEEEAVIRTGRRMDDLGRTEQHAECVTLQDVERQQVSPDSEPDDLLVAMVIDGESHSDSFSVAESSSQRVDLYSLEEINCSVCFLCFLDDTFGKN